MKVSVVTIVLACILLLSALAQGPKVNKNLPGPGSLTGAKGNLTKTSNRTAFDPRKHGFQFANTFQTELIVKDIRFGGLCGGMVYSSLDYFNAGKDIPRQNFRPPVRTPLFEQIYSRQEKSLTENVDKWLELVVNPFGARSDEFFRWGLQGTNGGRLEELRKEIDAGKPCPLGLFVAGSGGVRPHHQVLAIGYDLGRYRGDLGQYQEDLKIFVYDPNFPNRVMTLVPKIDQKSYEYLEDRNCKWMAYFVDRKYRAVNPPTIPASSLPQDGLVHQLQVEFQTGGDDLRGVNDNVNVTVKMKDGRMEVYENVNRRGRWIDNYCETVMINLKKPVKVADIACVEIQTTFGGGIGGDNWNLDGLLIVAILGGADARSIYANSGSPLVRFDGNNRPFKADIR